MTSQKHSPIPDEVIQEASELLNKAIKVLKPYLIALTPAKRQSIPKMSDKSLPFVNKTIAYSESSPQFVPRYMNTEALETDRQTYSQLIPLFRVVKMLSDGLDDTTMQAGGACFTNALNYYNSIKQAARIDVPGAKSIHEDLRKRFVKTKSQEELEHDDS